MCVCRFDSDLSASKEDASNEVLAKEQLAREKDRLHTDFDELKTKLKVTAGNPCMRSFRVGLNHNELHLINVLEVYSRSPGSQFLHCILVIL